MMLVVHLLWLAGQLVESFNEKRVTAFFFGAFHSSVVVRHCLADELVESSNDKTHEALIFLLALSINFRHRELSLYSAWLAQLVESFKQERNASFLLALSVNQLSSLFSVCLGSLSNDQATKYTKR